MFTIRKATLEDIPLINKLAWEAFPATYKNILTPEQIDYMMDWMYSPENLHKQMTEDQPEGKDLFHLQKIYVIPYYQKHHLGKLLFQQAIRGIKELHPEPCRMELNVNRENPALGFYQHMGMEKVREEDAHIGNGFYMNDYIMGISI